MPECYSNNEAYIKLETVWLDILNYDIALCLNLAQIIEIE